MAGKAYSGGCRGRERVAAQSEGDHKHVREQERAKIVLLRLDGKGVEAVAEQLGTTAKRVSMWCKRFEEKGLGGLEDKPGRGRRPSIPRQRLHGSSPRPPGRQKAQALERAQHGPPCWHIHSTVQRIWVKNELKPHLIKTFKLSNDPKFEEKFWDVIGLYLDPPAKALVLCCDEKSQCQALERTQLGLPLAPKRPRTRTHDYTRHGTVTLFAALNALEGKLIARTEKRHTHVEWLRFLKQIDRETPKGLAIHLIQDNYATHKHPKVRRGLSATSASSPTSRPLFVLDESRERFFADLTEESSGPELCLGERTRARYEAISPSEANPRPYKWKAEGARSSIKSSAPAALEKAQAA